MSKIGIIDFEPKHLVVEVKDWMQLHTIFFETKFGISFRSKLPFGGQYSRIPEYLEEQDEEDDESN